jgi:hypothetical protein
VEGVWCDLTAVGTQVQVVFADLMSERDGHGAGSEDLGCVCVVCCCVAVLCWMAALGGRLSCAMLLMLRTLSRRWWPPWHCAAVLLLGCRGQGLVGEGDSGRPRDLQSLLEKNLTRQWN